MSKSRKKVPVRPRKPAVKPTARKANRKPASSGQAVVKALARVLSKEHPSGFDPRPADTRWLAEIKVGKRHRKEFGDLDGLAASMNERGGLLQPIVVTPTSELIAGQRRMLAWKRSKFSKLPIPVHVLDVDSIVAGEWDENARRKDFTPSEAVDIQRALEPLEKAKAKQRQAEKPGAKSAEPKGRARDKVARLVGMDRRTLDKARAIVEAAERDPEQYAPLKEQMDKSGKVNGPYKRLVVRQQAAEIRNEPSPLPMQGPYRTIVADVPWPGEIDDPDPAARGRAYYPYATMSLAAIAAMGPAVQAICHPDGAWMWFWLPNHHLIHACHIEILKIWGFEPVALRTWVKDHFGNGQNLRGQTEQVILCRRGKPPALNLTNQSTKLEGKASGEHSEKPASFFADVEALCPAPRYAYLFAGRKVPANWDGHGDRVGKLAPADARAAEASLLAEAIASAPPAPATPPEPLGEEIADALALVENGLPIAPDLLERLRKQKFVTGKNKIKLSVLGAAHLTERRKAVASDRALKIALAELPDTIDGMVADYGATLRRHHVAALGGNHEGRLAEYERLTFLQMKANGGTTFGMAVDESPAARLRLENRAPVGEVPMWGQAGMFPLDVDGAPYIVSIDATLNYLTFGAYAASADRKFVSGTGFKSFTGGCFDEANREFPTVPVDEYCAQAIRAQALDLTAPTKKKKKPEGLLAPEQHYRLPASWEEADVPVPIGGFLAALDQATPATQSLINPKHLPSTAEVKRIADKAAARGSQ